ncbi:inositol monophosphatase family protein [Sphingomonas sp. LM7]|uniref:inositol monophosphatase family protein n=1 Tax=Sphingomonas sp. LM7 TaxID=1938607 RepID=UPI0009839C91|nr:inositol monophosphatase family protein [Sphingomonas sp. LM7]AQR75360.1 inositol monophosphatase [Sphingomonas sp. LM7]
MPLHEEVSALLRTVADTVVVPRFRTLAAHEVAIKTAGEIVTVVDRESELRLHAGLAKLGLGARILGEEAAEMDPALLDGVGEGLVWLIDPLDGTANFAAGRQPFGMMIALVEDGDPIAGWMLDPLSGRLCHAARGFGATINGARVRSRPTDTARPRAALGTHFLVSDRRVRAHAHADLHLDVVPVPRCAAESYPRLVLGEDDVALFQRILPWDHAAGALFLTEAGGHITHWDGAPYRVGGRSTGVLAAASDALWEQAANVLLGPAAGLVELECLTS